MRTLAALTLLLAATACHHPDDEDVHYEFRTDFNGTNKRGGTIIVINRNRSNNSSSYRNHNSSARRARAEGVAAAGLLIEGNKNGEATQVFLHYRTALGLAITAGSIDICSPYLPAPSIVFQSAKLTAQADGTITITDIDDLGRLHDDLFGAGQLTLHRDGSLQASGDSELRWTLPQTPPAEQRQQKGRVPGRLLLAGADGEPLIEVSHRTVHYHEATDPVFLDASTNGTSIVMLRANPFVLVSHAGSR